MSERPSGTICTLDELAISSGSSTLRCFSRAESLGLLVSNFFAVCILAQTGILDYNRSLVRVIGCGSLHLCRHFCAYLCSSMKTPFRLTNNLHVQWNIGRLYFNPGNRRQGMRLFHQPMDILMVLSYL